MFSPRKWYFCFIFQWISGNCFNIFENCFITAEENFLKMKQFENCFILNEKKHCYLHHEISKVILLSAAGRRPKILGVFDVHDKSETRSECNYFGNCVNAPGAQFRSFGNKLILWCDKSDTLFGRPNGGEILRVKYYVILRGTYLPPPKYYFLLLLDLGYLPTSQIAEKSIT